MAFVKAWIETFKREGMKSALFYLFYGTDIYFYDSDIFNIYSLNVDRKSVYTFYFSLCIQIFQISGFETIQKENEILFNVSTHLNFDKTAGIHYSIEQVQMLKHTLGVSE